MSEESITDIIADLRNDNIPRLSGVDMIRCLLHNTADRLDAAVKRIKKILADARCDIAVLDQLEYATTGEVAAPGNAAAMRKALERCNELFRFDDDNKSRLCHLARKADEATRAALAAPARNCDVGTAEEQAERFEAECKRHDHCTPCPVHAAWGEFKEGKPKSCQLIWAQMPIVPAEGGAE